MSNSFSDTLILQLGAILNTVPAWKKEFKLRVLVFVEYESDVEEERGRVESLLENLRIEAEVIVFWLASGNCLSYEIIVNGNSPDNEAEIEIEENLQGRDWWDELQRIRGKRGPLSGTEDLLEIANLFKTGPTWPDSSFQQGPRGKIVKRFRGLQKLLKNSKSKQIMGSINGLGVSLGMHTHRLSEGHIKIFQNQICTSDESGSSDDESDLDSINSKESAASEGDVKELDSGSKSVSGNAALISRRKSLNDCAMAKLSPNSLSCEINLHRPDVMERADTNVPDKTDAVHSDKNSQPLVRNITTIPQISTALKPVMDTKMSSKTPTRRDFNNIIAKSKNSTQAPSSQISPQSASGHVSQPKFSSKPVPIPRVATEDGPGPSIMFSESSPPPTQNLKSVPSAYSSGQFQGNIEDVDKQSIFARRGSSYSTQNLPLSFNDLPRRAQHLILNELIRSNSKETVVMFTTLPSPVEGTCQSEEASVEYLRDLELLCKKCPPVLMVHSNSMTVTVSL